DMVSRCIPEKAYAEQWDTDTLQEDAARVLGLQLPVKEWAAEEGIADEEIRERLMKESASKMAAKTANYGTELMRMAEKSLLLQLLDQAWKEHLLALDHLRQGIGLRAYGQKDPLNEYKREAFDMFEEMLNNLRETVTSVMCHLELSVDADELAAMEQAEYANQEMHETRSDPAFADNAGQGMHPAAVMQPAGSNVLSAATDPADAPPGWVLDEGLGRWVDPGDPETWGKVPRNAACPCGTGKKFKHCHGKV
ncbi:MAG: preprotein translocase subunit SecA, partial [Rhodospirillaceae bacterium]|nr:preprotein translocase subunit SecA [Rhodospirillaceae bacterium]